MVMDRDSRKSRIIRGGHLVIGLIFDKVLKMEYINRCIGRCGAWKIYIMALPVLLSGCATMQGLGGLGEASSTLIKKVSTYNPFDTTGSTFTQQVNEGQFTEAERLFSEKYDDFFGKLEAPTPEMERLAQHLVASRYANNIERVVAELGSIKSMTDRTAWSRVSSARKEAAKILDEMRKDRIIEKTRAGNNALEKVVKAENGIALITVSQRSDVILASADEVIQTGILPSDYPGDPLTAKDYRFSPGFQKRLLEVLTYDMSTEQREEGIARVRDFMDSRTEKTLIEAPKIKRAKDAILADGRVDLSELPQISQLISTYGENSGFKGLVTVGYVDLTATSFKDRNVFDFEIDFTPDYGINLKDAKDAFLSGDLSGYDFVFVTDLSVAKIFREFKNKQEHTSQQQVGTRQEPNPNYVTVASNYQTSLTDMNSVAMQNAIEGSKPCYGNPWVCALGGVARGVAEAGSRKKVEEAAATLARTPQTITKPVYSSYNYHTVNISASKLAKIDYYVIDTKLKTIRQSDFEVKDHEKFTVTYDVENTDPQQASILRQNYREEDVTAWEKKPISIKLSDLFSDTNLDKASKKKFVSAAAFLKPLADRKYASATPIFSERDVTHAVTTKEARSQVSIGSRDNGTIADERFDSVVIVKNAGSIGTGFYVTPDLVLTAHHVVDKAKLVEMIFYDGTKTYGKVIDYDVRLDLALVKSQTTGKPVKIHNGPIKLGETVEAIGHPKNYEFTITRGVISAMRRQGGPSLKASAPVEFIQTDTPISPGNSGGPLFLKNVVVGVNDWVRVDKASQNLNFSVSYNEIRTYLSRFEGMR